MRPRSSRFSKALLLMSAFLMAAYGSPALARVAGYFEFTSGDVRVIDSSGKERIARKGDALDEGDTVVTAKGASAQVSMIDKGFIAVRPDTRLAIKEYRYDGKDDGRKKASSA